MAHSVRWFMMICRSSSWQECPVRKQLVMTPEGNIKPIKIYQNPPSIFNKSIKIYLSKSTINFPSIHTNPSKSHQCPINPSISIGFPMVFSPQWIFPKRSPGGHRGKGIELLLDELLHVALGHLGHHPWWTGIDGLLRYGDFDGDFDGDSWFSYVFF